MNNVKRLTKLFALAFLLSMYTPYARAQESGLVTKDKSRRIASYNPYCGLRCLYAILKLSQRDVNFSALLKPDYIGSSRGSSLSELQKAAEDHALYAVPMKRLNTRELRDSPVPIILHVKRTPDRATYDHYVLFLGDKNGEAMVFDPPNPMQTMRYSELLARWSGTGLIVSSTPVNVSGMLAPTRKRFIFFTAILIIAMVLAKWAGQKWSQTIHNMATQRHFTCSVTQVCVLVLAALLMGAVYHLVNDDGFLSHAEATEPLVRANRVRFLARVSAGDVQRRIGRTVLIDARQMTDYEAGHIDNAISISTTLSAAERNEKLADIDKTCSLIVYCQSAGCPYAARVAARLLDDGFSNVAIYRGGWEDWERKKGK